MRAWVAWHLNSRSASEAKEWLAERSSPTRMLDVKHQVGVYNGYLLNGKYVTGESLGNYLFGVNLESLRLSTILDNFVYPLDNKADIFSRAAWHFGILHNPSNNVNNPQIPPYYGEIPYSGRMVVLGYYGGDMNNRFFDGVIHHFHGNPKYGEKVTVK